MYVIFNNVIKKYFHLSNITIVEKKLFYFYCKTYLSLYIVLSNLFYKVSIYIKLQFDKYQTLYDVIITLEFNNSFNPF